MTQVTPAQRRADAPTPDRAVPGDLYLDPDVPPAERVTVTRDGWTAQASHVWTGTTWCRLVAGAVRPVPSGRPLPIRRVPGPTSLAAARARRPDEEPLPLAG